MDDSAPVTKKPKIGSFPHTDSVLALYIRDLENYLERFCFFHWNKYGILEPENEDIEFNDEQHNTVLEKIDCLAEFFAHCENPELLCCASLSFERIEWLNTFKDTFKDLEEVIEHYWVPIYSSIVNQRKWDHLEHLGTLDYFDNQLYYYDPYNIILDILIEERSDVFFDDNGIGIETIFVKLSDFDLVKKLLDKRPDVLHQKLHNGCPLLHSLFPFDEASSMWYLLVYYERMLKETEEIKGALSEKGLDETIFDRFVEPLLYGELAALDINGNTPLHICLRTINSGSRRYTVPIFRKFLSIVVRTTSGRLSLGEKNGAGLTPYELSKVLPNLSLPEDVILQLRLH